MIYAWIKSNVYVKWNGIVMSKIIFFWRNDGSEIGMFKAYQYEKIVIKGKMIIVVYHLLLEMRCI